VKVGSFNRRLCIGLASLQARLRRTAAAPTLMDVVLEWHQLSQEGQALLGETGWTLLRAYGRVMSGKFTGQYVSGLPVDEVRSLLRALQRGQRVPVHLMHRHRSGNYESSSLSLSDGRLLMHYGSRTEPAE
jgi:hypothetical protein